MKMISKKNLDEWLFDYFEGNLSHSEQTTLHHFLEVNPECMEEFELWKETFISEPLPQAVPVKSLKVNNTNYLKLFSYISLPLLTIGLLFTGSIKYLESPVDQENQEQSKQRAIITPKVESPSPATLKLFKGKTNIQAFEEHDFKHQLKKLKAPEAISDAGKKKEEYIREDLSTDSIATVQITELKKEPEQVSKNVHKATDVKAPKKKLTKAERRARRTIRKMKRKAQERREQEQFIKGKKPYVVPVDLNNF